MALLKLPGIDLESRKVLLSPARKHSYTQRGFGIFNLSLNAIPEFTYLPYLQMEAYQTGLSVKGALQQFILHTGAVGTNWYLMPNNLLYLSRIP